MAARVTKLVRVDLVTITELDRLRVGRESYDSVIRRLILIDARVKALQAPEIQPTAAGEVPAQ